jgi:20S proteasome alpha/beta subunit
MTLIVAIGCSDGIVMGADSASTDIGSGTKQSSIKIAQVGNLPILCGGSGDVGLLQKIREGLDLITSLGQKFKVTRQSLKRVIVPELKEARDTHVAQNLQGFNIPPIASCLFGCVQGGLPFILEVELDGRDTMYDKNLGSFAAIGSGKPLAQAIFRPHLNTPRDLNLGKIFAYRILDDSIELAASGLARPIHLYTIDLSGKIEKIENGDLKKLGEDCELWRQLERDALGEFLSPSQPETEEISLPKPEVDESGS